MTLDELKKELKTKNLYLEIEPFNQEEHCEPYQITYTIYSHRYDDDPDPIDVISIDKLDDPKEIKWTYTLFKKWFDRKIGSIHDL